MKRNFMLSAPCFFCSVLSAFEQLSYSVRLHPILDASMSAIFPFCWPIRVYYEDTDIGGLVYHANYIKYFERARTEFLRNIGVHQQVLFENKIAFVVRHMDIDFFKGATLDDELVVQTRVSVLRGASIIFVQELVNLQEECLCRASVKVASISMQNMKPIPIPISIQSEILRER